ncbi:MAG: sugar ABC transporter substrate-binding protein, partial [Spirochaetales bacterium]|nr:sugar ABC transporter substrate-binding protein [Spirochaetales bacterium]
MRKRGLLVTAAVVMLFVGAVVFAQGQQGAKPAAEPTTLSISIRTLTNPYQANYKVGAEMFGKEKNLPVVALTCEGSSEKQLNDVRALVARTNGNVVFMIDPNEAPNVIPIARELDKAGVYWVSWWNKPEDVNVWDYKNWVSHISYDGISAGEFTAEALFKTFGGQGKIIALQGLLSNSIAQDRFVGLQNVLKKNPGVQLVAYEAADWDRTIAYEKTRNMLVANPDIKGIWAANDNMALGAIEALRSVGLAGKVKVTGVDGTEEIFDAIKNGTAAATVYNDSKYQAAIGLAIALAAKNGELDVASMTKDKRQFFADAVNVDASNVNEVVDVYVNG